MFQRYVSLTISIKIPDSLADDYQTDEVRHSLYQKVLSLMVAHPENVGMKIRSEEEMEALEACVKAKEEPEAEPIPTPPAPRSALEDQIAGLLDSFEEEV